MSQKYYTFPLGTQFTTDTGSVWYVIAGYNSYRKGYLCVSENNMYNGFFTKKQILQFLENKLLKVISQ